MAARPSPVAKALASRVYQNAPHYPGWGTSGWDYGQGAGLPQYRKPPVDIRKLPPDLRPRTPAQKREMYPTQPKEGSKGLHNWIRRYTGPRIIQV